LKGTGMSKYIERMVPEVRGWTPEYAAQYQLNALPAGEETDPETLAEFIAFLLSTKQRHKYLASTILPYGG
jgi:NAD(P)-dependent dehydrogenase (short-subunit alcohol dehydrogenase family)